MNRTLENILVITLGVSCALLPQIDPALAGWGALAGLASQPIFLWIGKRADSAAMQIMSVAYGAIFSYGVYTNLLS